MIADDEKQGPRAKDSDGLEERIQRWLDECQPTSAIERELATRAAKASWNLDRLERCEAALLSRRVSRMRLNSKAKRIAKAEDLGRKLFALKNQGLMEAEAPSTLVAALGETSEGARWLRDRWAEIRGLIASEAPWTFLDQFKFVRLMGKQPFDAIDDPELNRIFLAWETIQEGWGVRFWEKMREATPLYDPAFSAWRLWREITSRPVDAVAAVATLREVVAREIGRLETILAALADVEARDAGELIDAASFSAGDPAERLRRSKAVVTRELIKTVETLAKIRKESARPEPRKAAAPKPDFETPPAAAAAPVEDGPPTSAVEGGLRVVPRGGKAEGPRGRPSGLRGQDAATGSRVRTSSSSTSAGLRRRTGSPG